MAEASRKKMSDRVLSECVRHFWSVEGRRAAGMLSWGELTKMLKKLDIRLNNECMNSLYRISDQQKHGCINFTEFLATYCQRERKITLKAKAEWEPVKDLSAVKLNDLRREFFDAARKRFGKLNRLEFAEMTFTIGITMTNEELNEALSIADQSPNGMITFEGFICWFLCGMKNGDKAAAELEIIRRCFVLADLDGNGKLSLPEFRELLRNAGLGMDQRQAIHLFQQADADKSREIGFEEFKDVCLKTGFSFRAPSSDPGSDAIQLSSLSKDKVIKIREYFGGFDSNRDGRLSADECSRMLQNANMPEKIVRKGQILRKRNRDLSLSFRDFVQMFSSVEELDACVDACLTGPRIYRRSSAL